MLLEPGKGYGKAAAAKVGKKWRLVGPVPIVSVEFLDDNL